MKHLNGILDLTSGEPILGESVQGHPEREASQLSRKVGLVFQNPDHQIFAESGPGRGGLRPRLQGLSRGRSAGTRGGGPGRRRPDRKPRKRWTLPPRERGPPAGGGGRHAGYQAGGHRPGRDRRRGSTSGNWPGDDGVDQAAQRGWSHHPHGDARHARSRPRTPAGSSW